MHGTGMKDEKVIPENKGCMKEKTRTAQENHKISQENHKISHSNKDITGNDKDITGNAIIIGKKTNGKMKEEKRRDLRKVCLDLKVAGVYK